MSDADPWDGFTEGEALALDVSDIMDRPVMRYGTALAEQFVDHSRAMNEWLRDILDTIRAQRTVNQVPPFRPISLFGWVP